MVFSSVSIAPYGDAVSEAEGRAGWGRDMPALSYAETSALSGARPHGRASVLERAVRPSILEVG